jgi:hypothetical protein
MSHRKSTEDEEFWAEAANGFGLNSEKDEQSERSVRSETMATKH